MLFPFATYFILIIACSPQLGVNGEKATEAFRENVDCLFKPIDLVKIGGQSVELRSYLPTERSFTEEQVLTAKISPFWIGKYEVTAAQYDSFIEAVASAEESSTAVELRLSADWEEGSPYGAETSGDSREYPLTGINHWAAKRFCMWLSLRTGRFYRLPTEAEWELACGTVPNAAYPWGSNFSEAGKFARVGSGQRFPGKIGVFRPNKFGIYDMIGNAEEWVADGYTERCFGRVSNTDEGIWANVDPIQWPVAEFIQAYPEAGKHLTQSMRKHKQSMANGMAVAKGGSGLEFGDGTRCLSPHAFRGSARTQPENFDSTRPEPFVFAGPTTLSEPFRGIFGFRIARPESVPPRQIQLWHWGIYHDANKWLDLTLEPSSDVPH